VLWPASLSGARLHQRPRRAVVLLAPSAARRDVSVWPIADAGYEPIKDASSAVIGAYFVSYPK